MKIRRFLAWMPVAVIVIIAVYLRLAWSAGRAELSEMCERDLPPKVYKHVSAAGFYEHRVSCLQTGCWLLLINTPFRFIEFEKTRTLPPDPVGTELGFYRATKVRRDSGLCTERVSERLRTAYVYKPFYEAGNCIRIEKIERPTARYGLYVESLPTIRLNNLFDSVVARLHIYIKDMQTGELVAEQISVMLSQKTLPGFSSFSNMINCKTRGIMKQVPTLEVRPVAGIITPE